MTEGFFGKPYEILSDKHAHEEIDEVQDDSENRDARPRIDRPASKRRADTFPSIPLGEDRIDNNVDAIAALDIHDLPVFPGCNSVPLGYDLVPLKDQQRFSFGSGPRKHRVQPTVDRQVLLPLPGLRNRLLNVLEPFLGYGRCVEDGNTEIRRKELCIDINPLLFEFIGEVEEDGGLLSHVDQLLGEKQVAFQMDGIDDVEHNVGLKHAISRD